MIRRVALALLALPIAGGAVAQTPRPPYPYGFRAGFNFLNAVATPPPGNCTLADPSNIYGTDLAAWWDATDSSTITQTGGAISQWTAKGTLGLVATQATAANQPTIGTRNGVQTVLTNGTSQFLSFSPTNLPSTNAFVGVAGYLNLATSSNNWRRAFGYGSGDNNQTIQIIRRGSTMKAAEFTVGDATVDWASTDRFITVIKNGTAGSLFVDGVAGPTGTFAASLTLSNGYIGRGVQYSDNFPGSITQIVVVKRPPTANEQLKTDGWESWADGKAGANLPSSSPFKTRAPCTTD